jgi:hypothetical protein
VVGYDPTGLPWIAVVEHTSGPRLAAVSGGTRATTLDVMAGIAEPYGTVVLLAVMVNAAGETRSEPVALLAAKVPCAG